MPSIGHINDFGFDRNLQRVQRYKIAHKLAKEEHYKIIEDLRLQAMDCLEERNMNNCLDKLDKIIIYAKAAYNSNLYSKVNMAAVKL